MQNITEIPGYMDAVAQEQLVRDAAFLGINETICGFEAVPLTLWHLLALRIANNPLIYGGTPTPLQLVAFLWLVSPEYSSKSSEAKIQFGKRCKFFFPPRYLPLWNTRRARLSHALKVNRHLMEAARVITAVREYISEAMQDRPPSRKTEGMQADYYSDGAFFAALLGREFGWNQSDVMRLSLKCLFQYVNEIKQHSSHGKVPLCNPSDRVRNNWQKSMMKGRR